MTWWKTVWAFYSCFYVLAHDHPVSLCPSQDSLRWGKTPPHSQASSWKWWLTTNSNRRSYGTWVWGNEDGTQSGTAATLSTAASGLPCISLSPLPQLEPGLILCQDLSPEGSSLRASFPWEAGSFNITAPWSGPCRTYSESIRGALWLCSGCCGLEGKWAKWRMTRLGSPWSRAWDRDSNSADVLSLRKKRVRQVGWSRTRALKPPCIRSTWRACLNRVSGSPGLE